MPCVQCCIILEKCIPASLIHSLQKIKSISTASPFSTRPSEAHCMLTTVSAVLSHLV